MWGLQCGEFQLEKPGFLSEQNQVIGSAGQLVNSQTSCWAELPHSSLHPELEHVPPGHAKFK